MKDFRYRESFKIRSNEVGIDRLATPLAILHLMQEASMGSAVQLGVSIRELKPLNLAWVLLRKTFTIIDRPAIDEQVYVITYPSNFDRFLAYRDYKLYNSQGKLLAFASSTWTLLNFVDRKMARIPQELSNITVHPDEQLLEPPPSRLQVIQEATLVELIKVKLYDIDWNGHVNNLKYVKYILENILPEYRERSLDKIDFQIKAEAFIDDMIYVQSGETKSDELAHRLVHADTEKVIAIANTYWA